MKGLLRVSAVAMLVAGILLAIPLSQQHRGPWLRTYIYSHDLTSPQDSRLHFTTCEFAMQRDESSNTTKWSHIFPDRAAAEIDMRIEGLQPTPGECCIGIAGC